MARTKKGIFIKDVRGVIGKEFVLKQYASGTVISAYPDMSRVKRTAVQKLKQAVFAEAVSYAQSVIHDPVKKKAFAKKVKKGERVYNAAIKEYLAKEKGFAKKG